MVVPAQVRYFIGRLVFSLHKLLSPSCIRCSGKINSSDFLRIYKYILYVVYLREEQSVEESTFFRPSLYINTQIKKKAVKRFSDQWGFYGWRYFFISIMIGKKCINYRTKNMITVKQKYKISPGNRHHETLPWLSSSERAR